MEVIHKITVEPMAFLYMFAIFGEYTIVQDLVFLKSCLNVLNPNQTDVIECKIDRKNQTKELSSIETQSSEQLLYYNSILAITSIVGSFIAGSYGDSFGRMIPLSVPPLCSLLAQIVLIISYVNIESNLNIFFALIMVCAFISGISGSSSSFLANCFSFISDKSDDKMRTNRLVVLEANIFVGGFFGYFSAGLILKSLVHYKHLVCFGIYLTIHSIIFIYICLRLRTVDQNRSQRTTEYGFGVKFIINMFNDVIKTVFRRRQSNNRKLVLLLVLTFILVTYGTVVLTDLLFLYVRNRPLLWDTSMYAYYSGAKFGATGLALCSLPLVHHYLWPTMDDMGIAMAGVLSRTLGLILIGFATNTYVMFSSILVLTLSEYPLPTIRSILSKLVANNERGRIFAFLALFHNLCSLSGGIFYPTIYKYLIQIDSYSGLCFQMTSVLQMIAILILIYIKHELKSAHFGHTVLESNHCSNDTNISSEDNNREND